MALKMFSRVSMFAVGATALKVRSDDVDSEIQAVAKPQSSLWARHRARRTNHVVHEPLQVQRQSQQRSVTESDSPGSAPGVSEKTSLTPEEQELKQLSRAEKEKVNILLEQLKAGHRLRQLEQMEYMEDLKRGEAEIHEPSPKGWMADYLNMQRKEQEEARRKLRLEEEQEEFVREQKRQEEVRRSRLEKEQHCWPFCLLAIHVVCSYCVATDDVFVVASDIWCSSRAHDVFFVDSFRFAVPSSSVVFEQSFRLSVCDLN